MLVIRAGIHKKLVRIANREHPDQTRSSLIKVCPVCLDLFGRQLMFKFRTFTVLMTLDCLNPDYSGKTAAL